VSPGALDAETVGRHLAALDTAVAQLRTHTGRPLSVLETDLDELWAVERGLLLASQNALDLATHIAAAEGRDVPDYASAIDALAALGVLDGGFARRFRAVAGFRNLLVHGYLSVDRGRLHAILNEHLDDFVELAGRVRSYLAARG
jgi:uncharacterized protein YutE (UPF0331/DUF86 family)